jgi:hypothetical protein
MTIWLLALLLIGSVAAIGYRQGAVRVAFSLVAILVGAMVAGPLGGLLHRPLMAMGVKSPVTAWALGPVVVFVVLSLIFKIGGYTVHDLLEVRHKKISGSEGPVAWTRLNRRLGLCLGLLNGTLYLCLISFGIYTFSYWTVQVGSSIDSKSLRLLNRMGTDLQRAGFVKVARAVHTMPPSFYDMADLAGNLYHNSLLAARLSSYPGFLSLGERPEFEGLSSDTSFIELWQRQDPIETFLAYPKIQTIISNNALLTEIWNTTETDLQDLRTYLATGKSAHYDPITILGRWNFDVHTATLAAKRAHPNIGANEMQRMKTAMAAAFGRTTVVALPDHRLVLKNMPHPSATGLGNPQTYQGEWKDYAGAYEVSLQKQGSKETFETSIQSDRLTMKSPGLDYVFTRAD